MKEKLISKAMLFWGIAISILLGVFYLRLVDNRYILAGVFHSSKMIVVTSNSIEVPVDLPRQDVYVLKIKHIKIKGINKTISINNNMLNAYKVKTKGIITTSYYRINPEMTIKGSNLINIVFPFEAPEDIDLRIYNYLAKAFKGNLFVLAENSYFSKIHSLPIKNAFILAIFTFLLWQMLYYFHSKFVTVVKYVLLINLAIFLPYFLIIGILCFISLLSDFRIFLSGMYIYSLIFIWLFVMELFLIETIIIISTFNSSSHRRRLFGTLVEKILATENFSEWPVLYIKWVVSLRLCEKLVLSGVILIVLCGFLLGLKLESPAQFIAIIAYLLLMIGIVTKFIRLTKE